AGHAGRRSPSMGPCCATSPCASRTSISAAIARARRRPGLAFVPGRDWVRCASMRFLKRLARPSCLLIAAASCSTQKGAAGGSGQGGGDTGAIDLHDPTGDDDGPGTYKYPSDAVYKPGSFDLTRLEVIPSADTVEFRVSVNTKIEDPWG